MGLDIDEVSRRFRAEAADVNRKTELSFPAPVPERGVPAGAVILLSVVLIVAAYVGWYRFSDDRRPAAEAVPPVPEHLAALAAGAPPPAPPVPAPVPVPPVDAPVSVAPSAPPAPSTPATPAASTPPTPPPAADGGRMVVRAKADAWVQVRDKQGNVVFNRTMRPGETWPVPARQALLLTVGNAGGTEVLVDGVAAPALGADGVVRRDLPLDADLIRDGKLAVAPPVAAKLPQQR
jgi:cytoskeleton protein RodZ